MGEQKIGNQSLFSHLIRLSFQQNESIFHENLVQSRCKFFNLENESHLKLTKDTSILGQH